MLGPSDRWRRRRASRCGLCGGVLVDGCVSLMAIALLGWVSEGER